MSFTRWLVWRLGLHRFKDWLWVEPLPPGVVRVDITQVIRVTPNGLEYRDADGSLRSIDFAQCAANRARYLMTSRRLGEAAVASLRWVGERDIFAHPPYFELYSEPRTRLEFRFSWKCLSPEERFREFQWALRDAGWRTLDLG